jgi:hypothetical protein
MKTLNVGTRVVVIASQRDLIADSVHSKVKTGKEYLIGKVDRLDYMQPYSLMTLEGHPILSSWVSPDMIQVVKPEVPKVPKVSPKAPQRFKTHYSIQAKRNITREYLGLPRCAGGGIKKGVLVPLFAKYGIAVKHPTHAGQLLKDTKGWVWQYLNGGWDTSNAIAFKRTVEIKGVL